MKKFLLAVIAVAVFVLSFSLGQAAPLTETQISQMIGYFQERVDTVNLDFQQLINGGQYEKYYYSIPVSAGKKTFSIDIGQYKLYAYAGEGNNSLLKLAEIPVLNVEEGKKSTVRLKFKLIDYLLVPVEIDNPRGNFTEGNSYTVKMISGIGGGVEPGFSEYDSAVYRNGKLTFHVWAYEPYDSQSTLHLSIKDDYNREIDMMFNFDIMDIVSNDYKTIPLEPKTGEVEIEVGFADTTDDKIIVKPSPSTPASRQITAGTTMTATAEFSFKAVSGDLRINEVELELPSTAAACTTNGTALFEFMNSSQALGRSTFTGGMDMSTAAYATFTGLNFQIAKNSTKSVIAALNFVSWETGCQISGVNVQTTLTKIKAENLETGEEVIWNGRISGQPMYVYKIVPIITSKPVSQPLQNGWVTLNEIGISNSFGKGYAEWKEITYSFEKSSEIEILSVCLAEGGYINNDYGCGAGGYLIETLNIIDGSVGSTAGFITFVMINMEPAHSDIPLVLRAKLAGVTSGSYISTWVDRPSVYAAPDSYPNLVENSPNMSFAWSDRSAEPHRLFSKDWNNDFLVPGLPTAKQTVTR